MLLEQQTQQLADAKALEVLERARDRAIAPFPPSPPEPERDRQADTVDLTGILADDHDGLALDANIAKPGEIVAHPAYGPVSNIETERVLAVATDDLDVPFQQMTTRLTDALPGNSALSLIVHNPFALNHKDLLNKWENSKQNRSRGRSSTT